MKRHLLALVCLLLLPSAVRAQGRKEMLADSTTRSAWRLANGLEVRVRSVPGATSTVVTMAYRAGSFLETPTTPDVAALLAQVQFTAPAGDVPERRLEEMSSVRPSGWGIRTNPHVALLTEIVPAAHFTGLLHEVAVRAHGVQVTDSCLAHVHSAVTREVASRRFGAAEEALYERVRDLALGHDDGQLLQRASGRPLAALTPAAVDSLLRRYYRAANAALVLVGDFTEIDVRELVEREFGDASAGPAPPEIPTERLAPAQRISTLATLKQPLGVMGILPPPLDDSTHVAFYIHAVTMGGWWSREHRNKDSQLASYFQYSLYDEPELLRFDVDAGSSLGALPGFASAFNDRVEEFASLLMTEDAQRSVRAPFRWLLGGPLAPAQKAFALTSPPMLSTIATTTATRALWRGDSFWESYQKRFDTVHFGPTMFRAWMQDPAHQVPLILQPKP